MSTTITKTTKSTGLTKTGGPVLQLATRLERARQLRNERVARADAEYVESVREALASIDAPALPFADAGEEDVERLSA